MKIEQIESITKIKVNKKILVIIIIFVIITIGIIYFIASKTSNKPSALILRTAVAQKENLSTTITGSAPLFSSNKVSISGKTNGTIVKINFKEGDRVKAGDVLFVLDESEEMTNVENAQSDLDEVMLIQNTNKSSLEKLKVSAPINGQITNIAVTIGETIPKNGTLFTITDTRKMKLTVPFNGRDITKIKVGDNARINLQNQMESITGEVTFIGNAPYTTAEGGELYNVEISVSNPGALTEGTEASVDINVKNGTLSSLEAGRLNFTTKVIVKSETGGTIEKISEKLYQAVKSGDIIVSLTNSDITDSITSTALKLHSLAQRLITSKKQLSYCKITSPINGIVTEITVREGEVLKQGVVITNITNPSQMVFRIPVDELEIAKVKVNQRVDISVDALEKTSALPLKGKVKVVAVEGIPMNGVTTYDVTVAVTGVTNPGKINVTNVVKKTAKKSERKLELILGKTKQKVLRSLVQS